MQPRKERQRVSRRKKNGYPDSFVRRFMATDKKRPKPQTVRKKELFIRISFKGDKPREILGRRLAAEDDNCFTAASVRAVAKTKCFTAPQAKDRFPPQSISFVLHQFTCTCSGQYTGHTPKAFSKCIAEHYPAAPEKASSKHTHRYNTTLGQ